MFIFVYPFLQAGGEEVAGAAEGAVLLPPPPRGPAGPQDRDPPWRGPGRQHPTTPHQHQ